MNQTRGALCGGNWGTLGMECAFVDVDVRRGGTCTGEGGLAEGSSTAAAGEVIMREEIVMGTSPSFPNFVPD
jgi:hypothetical protein